MNGTSGYVSVRGWGRVAIGGLLVVLLSVSTSTAKHIYGGDMNLRASTRPGYYMLTLTLYLDQSNVAASDYETEIDLYIFRKSNNQRVTKVTVSQASSQQVLYRNQACATASSLKVLAIRYSRETALSATVFNDPGGYYVLWDRCCRNGAIDNIQNAQGTGMLFYMEFPPVSQNGTAFLNSSPEFSFPNGEYICLGKSFTLNFNATDADGDQLRYSLVDPLAGYSSAFNPLPDGTSHNTYPPIAWASGYSASNAIPGNPALQINAQTGQLSVKANRIGLFVFAVLCEEYRNGVRIGAIRREFQLPVVDCSKNTPAPAVITYNSQAMDEILFCQGNSVTLSVDANAQWSYQWQRNGNNIPGATLATLTTTEPGDYTVIKSFAKVCGNDTTSKATRVKEVTPSDTKITASKPPRLCDGDSLTLSVQQQPSVTYQWGFNGSPVPSATGLSLVVKKGGTYSVKAAVSNLTCRSSDSLLVAVNPAPNVTLTSSASAICQNGSVQLTPSTGAGYQYTWYLNNQLLPNASSSSLTVQQGGSYQVKILDVNQCQAQSLPLALVAIAGQAVVFDSIRPVCIGQTQLIPLLASPSGGQFSGPGVNGNQFDPAKAGPGLQTITYTISSKSSCPSTATRQVLVEQSPQVNLSSRVSVVAGSSVTLQPTTAGGPFTNVQWTPPQDLSDPGTLVTQASPQQSTTYQLTVTSSNGCQTQRSVLVDVLTPLFAADAFTPNSDGVNDVWAIQNIEKFPQCEVVIYNRWGEVVFYSKGYSQPWDGLYLHQKVQSGLYYYLIKTGQTLLPEVRGVLSVLY